VTLWSGRFEGSPAEALWDFTVDQSDRRLLVDDVHGSLAHVAMLGQVGILSDEETDLLKEGLWSILREAEGGTFAFLSTDEDVHSAVERRLGELKGEAAGKLHSGRSRNDQVALDLRLYLGRSTVARVGELLTMVGVLADQAETVGDLVVPSYTHLQQAQAVPLAHQLLAYGWMLLRDVDRFRDASRRINVSPLGAGAGGGSSLSLDPDAVAETLGLPATFENSLDAVGARDFAAEYVFGCAQAMVHLSRLAEDIVLWCTTEFGWLTMDDAFMTGSSAMPQKRNPDAAELVRGKAATVIGDSTSLLALQKGLPMTYNRDLQEDKRLVFHADDTLAGSLAVIGGMLSTSEFHPPAPSGNVTALDLAEALVDRGIPFREAHEAVGGLVTALDQRGRTLADVQESDLAEAHDAFLPEDLDRAHPTRSTNRRVTAGGGSMASVAAQLEAMRGRL